MATTPKQKFDAAVKVIHSLPKDGPFQPSYEMMLNFYAYYKQATEGKCKKTKPWAWDIVNKKKWDAWTKLGKMQREDAMLKYVEELKKTIKMYTEAGLKMKEKGEPIVEAMPQSDEVRTFMEKLGSFYEIVDEESPVHAAAKQHGTEEQLQNSGISGLKENSESGENSSENFSHSIMVESAIQNNTDQDLCMTNGDMDLEENGSENGTDRSEITGQEESINLTNGEISTDTDGHSQNQDMVNDKLTTVDTESEEEFCDTSDRPSQEDSGEEEEVIPSISTPLKSTSQKVGNHIGFDSVASVKRQGELNSMSPIKGEVIAQGKYGPLANDPSFGRREITDSLLVHGPGDSSMNISYDSGIMGRNSGDNVDGASHTGAEQGIVGTDSSSDNVTISNLNNNNIKKYGGGDMSPPGGSSSRQGQRSYGGNGSNMGQGSGFHSNQRRDGQGQQQSGSGQDGHGQGGPPYYYGQGNASINEHMALALVRLQQDMNDVLSRLSTLESKQKANERKEENTTWGRIVRRFPILRGNSVFFIFIWPIIVHWILLKIFYRRRNRPS